MPMTMQKLMDKTPQGRRNSAQSVVIREVKVTKTTYKTLKYKAKTWSRTDSVGNIKGGKPTIHKTMVETNGKQVVVDCDCEDFMYFWEYALNRKKAARLTRSNGEPPVDKNPRMVPGVCKHVYALGEKLLNRGKVI